MGIPGIYDQIGKGERVALSKVAVEHLERTGRPFRLAIDISIWQFQIQAGQGGKNPALRTLYYRLLRLLALSIHPLFVFDGPHKPLFKRGRKIAPDAACLPNFLTKELLKRFGFPYHTAPGEAEAECALLQKEGLVDAVLSEDVDTMMFGCSVTMRSWTAEGIRGHKSPTHVNLFKAKSTKEEKGLDSEGMILVALMSGGDYNPDGIPHCGIKIACEAARAGFGRDLCQISKDDTAGIEKWKDRLEHELITNKSKFFRQKHKNIRIPADFPDRAVWGYYTHPVVSSMDKIATLRSEIRWGLEVNVPDLRIFVADAFDWQYFSGAKKFVRGLAPAVLTHKLISYSQMSTADKDDLEVKEKAEQRLVSSICGRRSGHWNAGGEPELRIAYIPIDIVGMDLDAEEKDDSRSNGLDASGDEQLASEDEEARARSNSPTKKRGPSKYDPAQIEKIWMLETHVKLGVPLLVETWEEEMRNPKTFASRKAREKTKTTTLKGGLNPGTLDRYVKLTKPRPNNLAAEASTRVKQSTQVPPILPEPALVDVSTSQQREVLAENTRPVGQKSQKQRRPAEAKATRTRKATPASQISTPPKDRTVNPWTLAKTTPQKPVFNPPPPRDTLQGPSNLERAHNQEPPPRTSTPSPPAKKRHPRPTTPISDAETTTTTTEPPRAINANVTLRKPPKPSTPTTARNPSKPSPRKKRSPLQMATDLYLAGQLLTPSTTPSTTKDPPDDGTTAADTDTDTDPSSSSAKKAANRKLDFTAAQATTPSPSPISPSAPALVTAAAASSPPSSLPSPSTLFAPPDLLETRPPEKYTSPPSSSAVLVPVPAPAARVAGTRRLVALRESLEGAWKHLEPWDDGAAGGSSTRRVFSGVEVVDLTGC